MKIKTFLFIAGIALSTGQFFGMVPKQNGYLSKHPILFKEDGKPVFFGDAGEALHQKLFNDVTPENTTDVVVGPNRIVFTDQHAFNLKTERVDTAILSHIAQRKYASLSREEYDRFISSKSMPDYAPGTHWYAITTEGCIIFVPDGINCGAVGTDVYYEVSFDQDTEVADIKQRCSKRDFDAKFPPKLAPKPAPKLAAQPAPLPQVKQNQQVKNVVYIEALKKVLHYVSTPLKKIDTCAAVIGTKSVGSQNAGRVIMAGMFVVLGCAVYKMYGTYQDQDAEDSVSTDEKEDQEINTKKIISSHSNEANKGVEVCS